MTTNKMNKNTKLLSGLGTVVWGLVSIFLAYALMKEGIIQAIPAFLLMLVIALAVGIILLYPSMSAFQKETDEEEDLPEE